MLQNPLTCIKLWFLFQFLLLDVNCQMVPLKPKNRREHTATYIDDKLYILGGSHLSTDGNFFYHDFSVKFNIKNLSWQDLSNINSVPPIHYAAASARGGKNNYTLFLYGGAKYDPNMALVYTFDPQNEIWSAPKTKVDFSSINITRKDFLTGIVDYSGKMYLWGGQSVVDDFFILDTKNLRWEKGNLANAPISRFGYGATMILSNQNIIYMGGFNIKALPLNEVFLYDTINSNWSTKITSGKIPSSRDSFSVVLGLDGQRIIMFGGRDDRNLEIIDSLYVLNLTNFEWYIPKISGQIPKNRYSHKANVIGKYMVISFGSRFGINGVNNVDYNPLDGGDILLLDISNNDEYVWTNEFEPLLLSQATSSTTSPSTPSTTATSPSATATSLSPTTNKSSLSAASIAGAVVGTLLGGILLLLGCFFLYKWNRKQNKLLIHRSENREGNNKCLLYQNRNNRNKREIPHCYSYN